MVYKADKVRLKKLLMDAISLLCKNGLPVQSAFRIEATIGITLSEDEVVLVSFREIVQPDGIMVPQGGSDDEASVVASDDDFDCSPKDLKQDEDDNGSKHFSHAVLQNVVDENNVQNDMWNETGGVECTPTNSAFKKACAIEDASKSAASGCSADDTAQAGCSLSLVNSRGHGSMSNGNLSVQVKDEVIDDEDCTFVKMEDSAENVADAFESLDQDDSWMYQVYGESNLYGMTNNELSQFTQRQNYKPGDAAQAPSDNTQTWMSSIRDSARMSQPRQNCFAGGSGGAFRTGVKQSLPGGASRNQGRNVARTLQSLCKTLADQACSNVPGEAVFCHICGARLSSHATLVKHIKGTHLAMSTCQCDICGQSFKWTMQLCRHRKRYHSNVATE